MLLKRSLQQQFGCITSLSMHVFISTSALHAAERNANHKWFIQMKVTLMSICALT